MKEFHDNLSERLLLMHPDIRTHHLIRYELYKLLNLDFDLFFAEDIYNYTGDIYIINRNFLDHKCIQIKNPKYDHLNKSELDNGFMSFTLLATFSTFSTIRNIIELITPDNTLAFITPLYMIRTLASKNMLTNNQTSVLSHIDDYYAVMLEKPYILLKNIQNIINRYSL